MVLCLHVFVFLRFDVLLYCFVFLRFCMCCVSCRFVCFLFVVSFVFFLNICCMFLSLCDCLCVFVCFVFLLFYICCIFCIFDIVLGMS